MQVQWVGKIAFQTKNPALRQGNPVTFEVDL